MIVPSGPGRIIPFWPIWTRTLGAMIACLTQARSRCQRCQILLRVDLDALRDRLGGSASLINRSDACTVFGCGGTVYYLGAPAAGAAYHVLTDSPALLEGITDSVGQPFRSSWYGMVAAGAELASPAPAASVIDFPPLPASERS